MLALPTIVIKIIISTNTVFNYLAEHLYTLNIRAVKDKKLLKCFSVSILSFCSARIKCEIEIVSHSVAKLSSTSNCMQTVNP